MNFGDGQRTSVGLTKVALVCRNSPVNSSKVHRSMSESTKSTPWTKSIVMVSDSTTGGSIAVVVGTAVKPKRTFVSIITLISVVGVTLGVAVLIVVISVMAGFEEKIKEVVLGFEPHITVEKHGSIYLPFPEEPVVFEDFDEEGNVWTSYSNSPVASIEGGVTTMVKLSRQR